MRSWVEKWMSIFAEHESPKPRSLEQLNEAALAELRAYDTYLTVGRFKVTKDEFVTLLKAHEIDHKGGFYNGQLAPVPTFKGLIVEVV